MTTKNPWHKPLGAFFAYDNTMDGNTRALKKSLAGGLLAKRWIKILAKKKTNLRLSSDAQSTLLGHSVVTGEIPRIESHLPSY